MKLKIKFECNPSERSTHLRRKIICFFNLLGLTPTVDVPTDAEWRTLTIDEPAPTEEVVDNLLPFPPHHAKTNYHW